MNKKIFLDKILKYFIKDDDLIPDSLEDKIKLWEKVVTTKEFKNVPEDILIAEDKFLRLDLINRKLTDGEKLQTIDQTLNSDMTNSNKICLWKGDITTIYSDLIVNPTTNKCLLREDVYNNGLDYNIFLRSGMRLVMKCSSLLNNETLDDADILITRAYNLPCDYIVHVVVPNMEELTLEAEKILGMCYMNVLECAKNNMAKTVVIPCIGLNSNSDINKLAEISVNNVMKFLEDNNKCIEKVIFQVGSDELYQVYSKILVGDKNA